MGLSQQEIQDLTVGKGLLLTSGLPDEEDYLKAKVVVLSLGKSGCEVQITEILDHDCVNQKHDGDPVVATYAELEPIPEV